MRGAFLVSLLLAVGVGTVRIETAYDASLQAYNKNTHLISTSSQTISSTQATSTSTASQDGLTINSTENSISVPANEGPPQRQAVFWQSAKHLLDSAFSAKELSQILLVAQHEFAAHFQKIEHIKYPYVSESYLSEITYPEHADINVFYNSNLSNPNNSKMVKTVIWPHEKSADFCILLEDVEPDLISLGANDAEIQKIVRNPTPFVHGMANFGPYLIELKGRQFNGTLSFSYRDRCFEYAEVYTSLK